ncbi:hypothetical protein [Nitrospira moscoviensis]|uniref:Lipoprotein n=1 Tax=Nitrospira moscoviensis TaxID=42253 RepID=A0A0K2GBS1_NITMO|nr:hypothetical protein [Nitrospira moscoviensis]ALA58319.1 exported protein of unknown function [Nitrospira moscoviensis]
MTNRTLFLIMVVTACFVPALADAGRQAGKKGAVKEVKSLSEAEQTKLALSAAPSHIAKDAGVMIYGPDGKLTETRKSQNGFTCIPTVMNLPEPDPMCMDAAVQQWMSDLMNNAPKPTNTVPGIAYMARGGSHYEKDGQVVMSSEGAKVVSEPPHWMVMWPFEAAATKLPTKPNPSGVYIMFEGTPYAHLMVYQDPGKMK